MNTTNIEAEIFLHLVGKAWDRLPSGEQHSLQQKISKSLTTANPPEVLPVYLQHNPLKILLKGSGIFAVNSLVKTWLLKHIAQQFALHFVTYQTARTALLRGGTIAVTNLQNHLVMQTAKRGMAANAARYGLTRSVFSSIGPIMWGYFVAELGWKAIATNYSRVIPIIFTLAQIRLTRGEYWATA